jgi:anti-sigma regulatory factor (Ser/Thr protein kinase)
MTARPFAQTLAFELAPGPMAGSGARRECHSGAGPDQPVRVELRRGTDVLRVAVFDEGTGFASEAPLEPSEAGGWGLALVDRIADRWSVTPTGSGTCAWFEIAYTR